MDPWNVIRMYVCMYVCMYTCTRKDNVILPFVAMGSPNPIPLAPLPVTDGYLSSFTSPILGFPLDTVHLSNALQAVLEVQKKR
jgi:hypothetical protein